MNNEYVIINKTEWLKVMETNQKPASHHDGIYVSEAQNARADLIEEILSKSTPLIPEIEKAMDVAREIKDDSAHDTFTAEDISGCTEVCTYGWRYKTTNENYISNLKLDI